MTVAVSAAVVTAGVAAATATSSQAAVVAIGDAELSASELNEIVASLPESAPQIERGTIAADVTGQLIRQWIFNQSIVDELADRGWESTEQDRADGLSEINDPLFVVDSPFGQLTLDTLQHQNAAMRLAEALVAEEALAFPEYLCSSHILVATEAEAEEVVALLAEGADFATLAQERSLDGSGQAGGDLGCGPTMNYVAEFSDGARATGSGVSAPVQSQFGWHVINVRSIGPLTEENHPEMGAERVRQALGSFENQARQQAASEAFNEILVAAWDRTAGRVDLDARYGTWDVQRAVVARPSGLG